MKKLIITIMDNTGNNIHIETNGFNSFEIIGLLELLKYRIKAGDVYFEGGIK